MTTLGHRHRTPDWQVQSVFDPDGEGHDFAYTIGLHDRGLPELHIWGRPPMGEDPGDDWMFSDRDRCGILNELAFALIDGDKTVGSRWEERYDDGLVTVRFQLDPPGDRDELEAFGIAPGAEVLPLRWSLHRAPVARPRPLNKRGRERATNEYAAILDGLGAAASMPPGWLLPPRFEPGGAFGPLTLLVAGRVAEFWSADAATLSRLLEASVCLHVGGGLTWPGTVAAAVARELGRVDEVARTGDLATELVQQRTLQDTWPQVLAELIDEIGFGPGEAVPDEVEHGFHHNMGELLWTVLATEVVADRLTSAQRLHGRGAWLSGLAPYGELPGPPWRAPRRVLDRLSAALRPLAGDELHEIVARHRDESLEDYQTLSTQLEGWALVGPAGCPWRGVLDRLPGVLEIKRELARLRRLVAPAGLVVPEVARGTGLQQWATVMTSAACHRNRLSPSDVAALTAPFLDLVPELPGVVNGLES
ncbi:MAG TPA: hypothetical protein VFV89_04880 [Nocardioides sp.]|uniref:hypothetical protein n=1 Tax=Nocardioides sp. TaxID=35761 RepID=UPI002E33560D|nr:hypothetical protein [Nocardioides sp.]HEX5087121.1 hypothetical protein [Nocardioides sp.]